MHITLKNVNRKAAVQVRATLPVKSDRLSLHELRTQHAAGLKTNRYSSHTRIPLYLSYSGQTT